MPKIAIRRVIEEHFNVTEEDAKELRAAARSNDDTAIWDFFHANETGCPVKDSISIRTVKGTFISRTRSQHG